MPIASWTVFQVAWFVWLLCVPWAVAVTLRPGGHGRQRLRHLAILMGIAVALLAAAYLVPIIVYRSGGAMLLYPGSPYTPQDRGAQALVALMMRLLGEPSVGPWFVIHTMRLQLLLAPMLVYAVSFAAAGADRSPGSWASVSPESSPPGPDYRTGILHNALLLFCFQAFTVQGSLNACYFSYLGNMVCGVLLGAHCFINRQRVIGLVLLGSSAMLLGACRAETFVSVALLLLIVAALAAFRRQWSLVVLAAAVALVLAVFSVDSLRHIARLSRDVDTFMGEQKLRDAPLYLLPFRALKNALFNLPTSALGLLVATNGLGLLACWRLGNRWRARRLDLPETVAILFLVFTVVLVLGHQSGFGDISKYIPLVAVPVWYLAVRLTGPESAVRGHRILRWVAVVGGCFFTLGFLVMSLWSDIPREIRHLRFTEIPVVMRDLQRWAPHTPKDDQGRTQCRVGVVVPRLGGGDVEQEFWEYTCHAVRARLESHCTCVPVAGRLTRAPYKVGKVGAGPLTDCPLPPELRPEPDPGGRSTNLAVVLWYPKRARADPLDPRMLRRCRWKTSYNTPWITVLHRTGRAVR